MSEPLGATIAAVATGPSRGGIAVVRVSGPRALAAAHPLAPGAPPQPIPRQAYFTRVVDRAGGLLDEGLFLFFQGPHSVTGEDVVELQVHGSPSLASVLLREVLADGDVRLAEPGEFTRRSFLNGRVDLLRAEAVADLVAAESEAMVRAAAAQLQGAVSNRVSEVRMALEDVSADLEGLLNFPDEAAEAEPAIGEKLTRAQVRLKALVEESVRARRLRRGGRVVLFGPTNAGKSTLFNALLGSERALVDASPGTTRDVLEAPLELRGLPVTLVDTAGLRGGTRTGSGGETPSPLEALGIERAFAALEGADLAVLVIPPDAQVWQEEAWSERVRTGLAPVRVLAKADLRSPAEAEVGAIRVSGKTGEGLEALRAALWEGLGGGELAHASGTFSDRAEEALARAVTHLADAVEAFRTSTLEVVAGEVTLAREALDDLSGRSVPGAVVDEVFRRFCIGK